MTLYNYSADDKDWEKLSKILLCLPKETNEFLRKFLSHHEALKAIEPSDKYILFDILSDSSEYGNFTKHYFERMKSEINYDNRLSASIVKHILPVFGSIDENHLSALSPLNLCLLICPDFIIIIDRSFLAINNNLVNEEFKKLAQNEEKEYLKKLHNSLMKNTNMEVQSFFKTCASINEFLNAYDIDNRFTRKEKIDLSILLSMFYYKDTNKNYNIKEEFIKIFSDILNEDKILEYIGINKESFDYTDFYNPIALNGFKDELSINDIFVTLSHLFGEKNSNSLINDLCNYIGIDDDELYERLKLLENSKKESASNEEVETKYLSLFKDENIKTTKIYNTASWVYDYLDKFKDSEYRNNPNKRRILSLLISAFLNFSDELIYLENEGISLESLLSVTIHNTELSDANFTYDKQTRERVVVHKLSRGGIYQYDSILKSLLSSRDKDIDLIFIKLGKDINTILNKMENKVLEKPKLTYQEEIELINTDRPLIDTSSYSSISSYGNNIMSGVNNAINEVLHIIHEDMTPKKLEEIQSGVSSVYEEKQISLPQKKSGILGWLLEDEQEAEEKVEIVIHFDYIRELEEKISGFSSDIDKQIFVYDWIQKRNIAYAKKLNEYIELAKREKEKLVSNKPNLDENDPSSLFQLQYFKTQYDLLESKIKSLETSYMTMLQHFMAVDNAIRAHSASSDALRRVINDFIPLLSSNMLISAGIETDKQANQIVKSIVLLTNNYLSNNVSGAKEILSDLQSAGIPEDRILRIKSDLELKSNNEDESKQEDKQDDNQIKLVL